MPDLIWMGKSYSISLGRSGLIPPDQKREGDGKTPLGVYPLRECWYRADRIQPAPQTKLSLKIIHPDDCWCDDPKHGLYNRHFRLPIPQDETSPHLGWEGDAATSYEHLWREDHTYDLLIPIGYNDDPIVPGKGSAIFIHCKHDDGRATAGCIALNQHDLLEILPQLSINNTITITTESVILNL